MFSAENSLKTFENEQKRLKMAEKSVLTSFRVHAVSKSWMKYTTPDPSVLQTAGEVQHVPVMILALEGATSFLTE